MSIVETIKSICKERKIPIYKLEKDCGFANAYISQLKKGTMPYERLVTVAKYLDIPVEELAGGTLSGSSESAGKIPVLGVVRAGEMHPEYECVLDYITADYKNKDEYFALMVKGDSMQPRLYEGDIVVVHRQEDAENGEMVVAQVNGDEAVVKKLIKFAHGIGLQSLNKDYPLVQYSEQDIAEKPVRILGKVVEMRVRM